jgi:uncharacterized protein YyaL (SSP411 family)
VSATPGAAAGPPTPGENRRVREKSPYRLLHARNPVLRLSRFAADPAFEARAAEVLRAFSSSVEAAPARFARLLLAAEAREGPSAEVVICGDPGAPDAQALLEALRGTWRPGVARLLKEPGPRGEALVRIAPWTRDCVMREGRATAYVCVRGSCRLPVSDPDELAAAFKKL